MRIDRYSDSPGEEAASAKIIALIIVVLLLVATFPLYFPQIQNFLTALGLNPYSRNLPPEFNLTTFKPPSIVLPSDYSTLANYVLGLINEDRQSNGLSNVTLSPVLSAEQHAISMRDNHYFSHWDTQGLKPYMRYSLYNGTGSVEENVAWESRSPLGFPDTPSREQALQQLEYQMMNNDSICCNNGHRDNILTGFHNSVAIGVAYDNNNVYLVQDFENSYISWLTYPNLTKNGIFSMVGQLTDSSLNPSLIYIYYDSYPQPLTAAQLSQPPYNGEYTPGSPLGCVTKSQFMQCSVSNNPLTTVPASTWSQNSTGFLRISFNGTSFIQSGGKGVYTIYLAISGSTDTLTSISFFVSG
jgi:uncharacterized protein YkwD